MLLEFYQTLPLRLSPLIEFGGFFRLNWYALSYFLGFATVTTLVWWRFKHGENSTSKNFAAFSGALDFLLVGFLGALLGGRLGYALFYTPDFFWHNPSQIFWPFDAAGRYVGIRGMSFFGAVWGVLIFSRTFCWQKKLNFWESWAFLLPAIPAGYFWGRLGNFFNGELYGKATMVPWGMYFSQGGQVLRHPTQLYEAVGEGLLLFGLLWFWRQRLAEQKWLLVGWFGGYGLVRLGVEFLREQAGADTWGIFAKGQIGALLFLLVALGWGSKLLKSRRGIIK